MIKGKKRTRDWINNDTFALKITNIKDKNFYGRYLIFIIIKGKNWGKSNYMPIFRVKLSKDDKLPQSKEELENAEYIQTGITCWEKRYGPILPNVTAEKKRREERDKIKFYPDEFGYMKNFQIALRPRHRTLPTNLEYIGNFELSLPQEEYQYTDEISIDFQLWDICEEHLIDCYKKYNLKDPEIYNMETAMMSRKFAEDMDNIVCNYFREIEQNPPIRGKEPRFVRDSLTYVGNDEEKKNK